jgi:hypothetical protein
LKLLLAALIAVLVLALYEVDRAWRLALDSQIRFQLQLLSTLPAGADTQVFGSLPDTPVVIRRPETPGRLDGDDSVRLIGPGVARSRQIHL